MTIIQADILKWAESYTGPKFHAMLSDPPYHLTEITKRFGKPGAAPAQHGTDGAFQRASKGFMGRDWDGGDIAFRPETWAAIAQHLYPGAWGMAFAGSRGWHRMACAIEDAGLIIQPTIFGWSYGSGFPKATRIDTQIDAAAFRAWLKLHPVEQAAIKAAREAEKAARRAKDTQATKETRAQLQALTMAYKASAGLLPEKIGTKKHQPKFAAAELGYREKDNGYNSRERETFDVMACATEAARFWLGHRYGGQALKPAIEPVIVFQKPYEGSPLACITSTGAGALWIDGGRIDTGERWSRNNAPGQNGIFNASGGPVESSAGRWPANMVLGCSPRCDGADHAPGCPVAALGAQSGESSSSERHNDRRYEPKNPEGWRMASHEGARRTIEGTGTAARFFYQADYMYERLELADAIQYVAKASRGEREAGLDPRQTAIMRLLDDSEDWEEFEGADDTPASYSGNKTVRRCGKHGSAVRSGSNQYTCGCSIAYGFDATTVSDGRETPIDNPYQRGETTRRNTHPTIKPLSLCKYLATLLLPPAAYAPRRLLVPFAGAASEMVGAELAGWEDVTGIELEESHVAIAEARIAYWRQRRWEFGDPARKLTVKAAPKVPAGQIDMFTEEAA